MTTLVDLTVIGERLPDEIGTAVEINGDAYVLTSTQGFGHTVTERHFELAALWFARHREDFVENYPGDTVILARGRM